MYRKYSDEWLSRPCWHVLTNLGEIISQDEPNMNWLRLKNEVESGLYSIVSLWLSFRDNEVKTLKDGQYGYLFGKKQIKKYPEQTTADFYVIGYLPFQSEDIHVEIWKIPELILQETQIRKTYDDERVGDFLIRNQF